jgi:two-component system, sensor histidine kinase
MLDVSRKFVPRSIPSMLQFFAGNCVAFAVGLNCVAFITGSVLSLKSSQRQQVEALSLILSHNLAAAVELQDSLQANSLLGSLKAESSIVAAAILGTDGKFIGAYPNQADARSLLSSKSVISGSNHFVAQPILRDGAVIGELRLRTDFSTTNEAIVKWVTLTVLVGIGSLLAALVVARFLQRSLCKPLLRFDEIARKVTVKGDFRARVEGKSDDGVGLLNTAFIEMLDKIETSNRGLQEANDRFEERVSQRTAELTAALDTAESASRAKSDFLANMSHEIRTPLNVMMGYADLLRRGWDESLAEREDMLKTIHTSGQHLMRVIDDILDNSKIESRRLELEVRSESPHRVLSEVVSLMRVPFREKNLDLEYNWIGVVPKQVELDGLRLRQILINILENARKFTSQGGVQIIAKFLKEESNGILSVEVIDTGIGIPKEKQSQIFEAFMQADTSVTRKFGGTGLGLTISRQLARMMGGDLSVESEVGCGSCFRLTLNAGQYDAIEVVPCGAIRDSLLREEGPSEKDDATASIPGLRVLVVDDGATYRKLASLVLRRGGAVVSLAENGMEACDMVLQNGNFDVILMDMQMPVLDGYGATRKLREAGIMIPILALTAHAMTGDKQLCLDSGCSDYLTKPINAAELLAQMKLIYDSLYPEQPRQPQPIAVAAIESQLPIEDPEFAEIVVDFIDALERETEELRDAVQVRDTVKTAQIAHWMRGTGGTAGFPCLTAPSIQLTQAVKGQAWDQAERQLAAIEELLNRLISPRREEK